MEYLLTFGSAHRALEAEAALMDTDVVYKLKAAPKALEPFCELVVSVDETALEAAKTALKAAGVGIRSVYRREGSDYVKV